MPSVRIAVISDPHFYETNAGRQAYSHLPIGADLKIESSSRGANKNPHDDLLDLIARDGLTADLLICAGDITTFAQPKALTAGWIHLQAAAKALNCSVLSAATGNHDVDSRSKEEQFAANFVRAAGTMSGPLENLKNLNPSYPVNYLPMSEPVLERTARTEYWSEAFTMIDLPDMGCRLVVFNSCAEHDNQAASYERGSTPKSALRDLSCAIQRQPHSRINVLVGHHPLIPQSDEHDVFSYQARGDQVLCALESYNDDWLLISGHRHSGELKCGPSHTGVDMTMLSAASFSGVMSDPIGATANQFYIIELDRDEAGSLRGAVQSWDWNLGSRWKPSSQEAGHGICDGCGFGSRLKPPQIAKMIKDSVDAGMTSWPVILAHTSELKYVLPSAMRAARRLLESKYKLVLEYDSKGMFADISEKA